MNRGRQLMRMLPPALGILALLPVSSPCSLCPPPLLMEIRGERLGNFDDAASAVAVDGGGNIIAAGSEDRREIGEGLNWFVVKYDTAGSLLWKRSYNGEANRDDKAVGVAVDSTGNAVVAGSEDRNDRFEGKNWLVRKYDANGALLWSRSHDGAANGDDEAYGVAVDSAGNAVVAGYETDPSQGMDWLVRKYDTAGAVLWSKAYDGPADGDDSALAVAVDPSGSVYAAGYEYRSDRSDGLNWHVRKYGRNGGLMWSASHSGNEYGDYTANAVAADAAGNIVVAGTEDRNDESQGLDWLVRKYGHDGSLSWSRSYNGPADGDDSAYAVAMDSMGNAVVAGYADRSDLDRGDDWLVLKYGPGGNLLCGREHNGGANGADRPGGIAVDSAGFIYLAGFEDRSDLGRGNEWLILKLGVLGRAVLRLEISLSPRAPIPGQDAEVRVTVNNQTGCSVADVSADISVSGTSLPVVVRVPGSVSGLEPDASLTMTGTIRTARAGTLLVSAAVSGKSLADGTVVTARTGTSLPIQRGPDVPAGGMIAAPNVLDLSAGSGYITFHLQGNPGETVELTVYDTAGLFMGLVKTTLDAGGAGEIRYGSGGISGRKPGPGTYRAVARGGGINDHRLFFVTARRGG